MPFAEQFIAELDQEAKTTRSLLERIPMEQYDWKPHPKSRSIGELADHLSGLVASGKAVATQPELRAGNAAPIRSADVTELLARYDANVQASRDAIAALPDDQLGTPWTLYFRDTPVFTLPRKHVLRALLMSHMIHHRGQLSVYLRQLDVPLPSIYGPTADT